MARIASGVNACCYLNVSYCVIKNAFRRHSSACRRKIPNVSPSHWTISFSSISLLSLCVLHSVVLYIFCTNRVTTSSLYCIHFYRTLKRNFTFFSLNFTWIPNFILSIRTPKKNLSMSGFSKIWMIRLLPIVRKFHFVIILRACRRSHFLFYNVHIVIDLKTFFISLEMILELKSVIQIGTVIFNKKVLTPRVGVLDGIIYFTSINH